VCEYCGCQQIEELGELTREHEEIRGIAREAMDAGSPDAAVAAVQRLLAALGPHNRVEEDGVFAAMAAQFPEHTDSLRADHQEIGDLIAAFLTDPAERAPLYRAVDLLFEHILREQDGLFPAALAYLGPADWDGIDRLRAQTRGRGFPLTR
jgi:hypothetical protein